MSQATARDAADNMRRPGATSPAAGRAARIGVIVTEFPKITETFVMRDVVGFEAHGYELRLYHLTHFNHDEVIHDFARGVLPLARDFAYIASLDVIGATLRTMFGRPGKFFGIVRDIVRGSWRDPVMLLKSLYILPKSIRIAEDLRDFGAEHVHAAYAGHPATTAWIVRRLTGIPFSLSSHAHDIFETRALLNVKLPEADFVRTISRFNRDYLLRHVPELADRPPIVIHVGALLETIPALPAPDPAGPFRVLYVGSLELRKGIDTLLRAVKQAEIGDWRLDIVGKGPERDRLDALTEELGLRDRVTFHGGQQFAAVSRAIGACSVLVVPSRIGPRNQTEGLPTIIVEAFAHQRPVIASRLTGIPEIVIQGETGLLVEVDDVEGFAHALEEVRRDPDTAFRRAQRGRALVVAEFDQARSVAALAALIDGSILASRQRAAT